MRNYKLTIEYDGTNFSGWQRLPGNKQTIQGTLETTISEILGYEATINGSGRTDAGVHAMAQVANVHTSGKLDEEIFRDELNNKLPNEIQVTQVELVKNSFHSRYDAKGKTYIYTIDTSDKASVFNRRSSYNYVGRLEIEKMKEAVKYLIGSHDFTSFSDNKDHTNNTRTIYGINIEQNRNLITIIYQGNGFLNHMVRIITGTLIEIGAGKKDPGDMEKILKSRMRNQAGVIAPAKGLALKEVKY